MYADNFDMQRVYKLIGGMKGRVLLNAASKPYISVNLKGQNPLSVLEDSLKLMCDEAE